MLTYENFYSLLKSDPQAYNNFIYWLAEVAIEKYNIADGPRCLALIKARQYQVHTTVVMEYLLWAGAQGVSGLNSAINQLCAEFALRSQIQYKFILISNNITDTKISRLLYA